MKHRIFIAINLPENVRKKLEDYQRKWPELPVRWTRSYNLHITLVFLGYLSDEELLKVCNITREVASQNSQFSINLKKIIYGPRTGAPASREALASRPQKIPYSETSSLTGRLAEGENRPPRMIWVEGEKSIELGKLQKDLENSLSSSPVKELKSENRPYASHITLGRIKTWEFRRIEPEARPEVNEEIDLNFEVNSIDVMESELKRGGPNYTLLESCPLKS